MAIEKSPPERSGSRAGADQAAGASPPAAGHAPAGRPPRHPSDPPDRALDPKAAAYRRGQVPIVAIGASAGGLEALQAFFSRVPAPCGMGFVVVTHVRPDRPSLLPELLANVTPLRVAAAEDGMRAAPDLLIVAKDSLLTITDGVLGHVAADSEPEVRHHPIDYFFRALARDQGEHAIAVVLSGSGNDGTVGIDAIKANGGMVMVQTPESAAYAGMPTSALDTGLADYVLPPEALPQGLVAYCRGPFLRCAPGPRIPLLPGDAIRAILLRLRSHTGHDFTCYKRSTVSRRIQQRMNVHRIDEPKAYLRYLQTHGEELDILLQDLLVSVTSFFRDPEAFAALAEKGIPQLLAQRADGETLRVWVAGCATGEEAYSVAVLLHEAIRESNHLHDVQIFATDLNARAIEVARHGLYPRAIAVDVSPERLKQYFTPEDGAFRIRKNIRDMLVFAVQNVLSDPPFTRMDLVVCRNLLIYLDSAGQQRVLPALHYALRPGGLLFLGSSDSIGESTELFETLDTKHKILRRRQGATSLPAAQAMVLEPTRLSPRPGAAPADTQRLAQALERLLLERYAPCSVLVDRDGTVVYLRGRCGPYLEPEQGRPCNNLIDMVCEGGTRALSTSLARALEEQREVLRLGVPIKTNGSVGHVDLRVIPLSAPALLRGHLLVTFTPSAGFLRSGERTPDGDEAAGAAAERDELARELSFTRESLTSTIEELQTANEELHSSNEELETSREELQSLNEELNTVNAEFQSKIETLSRANDDMRNLLNSIQVATIFLDPQLRVKRYTEPARDVVRLIDSDVGRPLSDLTSSLRYDTLMEDCQRVLATLVPVEREVQDIEGRWRLVRLTPYRRTDNVIDGLVMTVIDIDRSKQAEQRAHAGHEYLEAIAQVVREPLVVLDTGLRVVEANDAFYQAFASPPKQVEGRPIYELGNRQWDIPALRELLEHVLSDTNLTSDFRIEHHFPRIGHRIFLVNARRLAPLVGGNQELIIMAFEDATPRLT